MAQRIQSATALFFLVTLLITFPLTSFAQVNRPAASPRVKQEPCWQIAGISQSAIEQRQAIMRDTRTQVQAVCSDQTLTAQQRQQKIREIRRQAQQQAEGLVTPEQQETLQSCRKERNGNVATPHPAAAAPCGQPLQAHNPNSGSQGTQAENPQP